MHYTYMSLVFRLGNWVCMCDTLVFSYFDLSLFLCISSSSFWNRRCLVRSRDGFPWLFSLAKCLHCRGARALLQTGNEWTKEGSIHFCLRRMLTKVKLKHYVGNHFILLSVFLCIVSAFSVTLPPPAYMSRRVTRFAPPWLKPWRPFCLTPFILRKLFERTIHGRKLNRHSTSC